MSAAEKDYLSMSDEDFLNDPDLESDPVEEETAEQEEPEIEEAAESEDVAATDDAEGDEGEDESEESDEGEAEEGSEEEDEPEEPEEEEGGKAESKDEADTPEGPNYEEFHKAITQGFKANGKEFKIDNAADAVQLMQMGVNYNKKMAAMKPSLKSLRLLEKHGLLDEEKLNFLIDINDKNPQAIAKLLQDSKLDPMDIDVDEGTKYTAPNRTVDDKEMELNHVLDELKDSATYVELLDTVSNKWDANSKQTIADTPQILNVINEHMASGVYPIINEKIERERTFGRLQGLTDLEAYRQVGDDLQANGGFDHLFSAKEQGQQNPKRKVIPKRDEQKDTSRKDKRRAAGSTKATVNSGKKFDSLNPLGMSDEEFMKEFNPNLL